eukprot:3629839-Pyramimonas_sp.AAC.1
MGLRSSVASWGRWSDYKAIAYLALPADCVERFMNSDKMWSGGGQRCGVGCGEGAGVERRSEPVRGHTMGEG